MRSTIIEPRGAPEHARLEQVQRLMLRLVGGALLLDAIYRLSTGRSVVSEQPLRRVFQQITGRSPEIRPAQWQEVLLGLGELGAAIKIFASVPFSPAELATVAPSAYAWAIGRVGHLTLGEANDAFLRAVSEALPESGRLLGIGNNAEVLGLLERGSVPLGTYVGVDESEALLAPARRHHGDRPNVTLLQRDLDAEPLPGLAYDVVVGHWALALPDDPIGLVTRAWHALAPEGTIVLLLPTTRRSRQSVLIRPLARALSLRTLPHDVVEQFPDRCRLQEFAGGLVTLVVMQKQKE